MEPGVGGRLTHPTPEAPAPSLFQAMWGHTRAGLVPGPVQGERPLCVSLLYYISQHTVGGAG